jgi:hypothetical protein
MPDFDTRTRQEPDEPDGPRNPSIVSGVRALLIAMRLRTLLIGGGVLLFVVVAVPVGLIGYSYSGLAPGTVTCDEFELGKLGHCYAPGTWDTVEVCKAASRNEVNDYTPCRKAPSDTPQFATGSYLVNTMEECLEIRRQDKSLPRCRKTPSFLEKLSFRIWMALP